MKKRSRKLISVLLTLALLATLLVPMATPAAAATSYGVLTTPTVTTGTTATLGTITISVSILGAGVHSALISLPNDYAVSVPTLTTGKITPANATVAHDVYTAGYAKNEFRIQTATTAAATDVLFTVSLPGVTIPSDAAQGDIRANITGLGGQFSSGSVVVGRVSSGAVTVSVNDTLTVTEAGIPVLNGASINVSENSQFALKKEHATLKLTLPKGFTWNTTGAAITRVNDGTVVANTYITTDSNNSRTLTLNRTTADTTARSIFRLAAGINVNTSEAKLGDVTVTVGGTSSYSPSEFVIGTYKEYGVTVTANSVESVTPGRVDQKLGKIEIKENSADSLPTSRTVQMELPVGAKWASLQVTASGGGLTTSNLGAVGTDGRVVKFTVTNAAAGGSGTITIENANVDLAVNFSGDVTVGFSGSAGITGTYKVGEAAAIVTATANTPDVKIGVRGADAGDIIITESKKEAFKSGKNIVLIAPAGVEWTSLPTVEVVEGDITLDTKAMTRSGRNLTIPVTGQSSKPAKIKVSKIKFTVDRTVPEGPMPVAIRGNAIDEVNDAEVTKLLVNARPFYTVTGSMIFPQNENAAVVNNARCVTPSPADQLTAASFVIGSTTYKVGSVEKAMDVAPYLKNGRTYLPVRYVAEALGVASDNILWDAASQTVTLLKGDKVVQLKIGSKAMLVNGATINMDAAAEITSGRTMLPFRFIAQALGASVTWDEATRTVTLK